MSEKLLDRLLKIQAQAEGEAAIGNSRAAENFAAMLNRLLIQHEMSELDLATRAKQLTTDEPIVKVFVDRYAAGLPLKRTRVQWEE